MNFIVENWALILGLLCLAVNVVYWIVKFFTNIKRLKTATKSEDKQSIIDEIKSDTYGLINYAEQLFSDIPKSGASKLVYVLNEIKKICEELGHEYDSSYWTNFINQIVGQSNEVKQNKELEASKITTIAKVKEEIPLLIKEAQTMFANIPDNSQYMIEYILKFVEFVV